MTSVVVTNAGTGVIYLNGAELSPSACRGIALPLVIEGAGEVFLSCNPDPDISDAIYDADGNLVSPAVPASPVSAVISDALGEIAILEQNSRFPYEGAFPVLRPISVR